MPNHLVPSAFNGGLSSSGALTPIPRPVGRALDAVRHQGMLGAAHVQAAAYVAHVAMEEIGILSLEEALLSEGCPHAQGRLTAIVDHFTAVAARDVVRMGL